MSEQEIRIWWSAGSFLGGLLVSIGAGWKVKQDYDEKLHLMRNDMKARLSMMDASVKRAVDRIEETPRRIDDLENENRLLSGKINQLELDQQQDRGFIQRSLRAVQAHISEMREYLDRAEEREHQ